MSSPHSTDGQTFWERPATIRAITIVLFAICVVVAAADLTYENPHPHFDLEKVPAFQAAFGFVAFVVIVMLGRMMRWFVSRDENYYEQKDLPEPRRYASEGSSEDHA